MSLPLLHAGRTNPGLSAALDLRFALDKSLTAYRGPTPSFSRASTGSYFNSSGVLTSASINAPRFNHTYNGTSWVSRGLLVEEQRTNLATNSELFSNASWTKYESSVTANAQTSPDGTNSGFKFIPSANGTLHYLYMNPAMAANTSYTCSVFAKKAEYKYLQIGLIYNPTSDCGAQFDLDAGTVTRQSGQSAGYTAANAIITNVGNGWFRCSVTLSAGRSDMALNITGSNTLWTSGPSYLSFTGDGTSGIYLWGAQMELGAFPTSYIPATTATTRSADVCQITGTSFSSFWNASEGSIAFQFDLIPPASVTGTGSSPSLISFTDPSNNQRFFYDADTTPRTRFYVDDLSTSSSVYVNENVWGQTAQKAAYCYKVNDLASCLNGGTVQTDTSQNLPTGIDRMSIGYNAAYGANGRMNGHISRLRYYPTRLTNAQLQSLST